MERRPIKNIDQYKLDDVPVRERNDKAVRIMDPVHNFIDVSEYPVILQLINTPHFQRLKSLQQLGLASTVYPSATHTRFAHSIGVMYVFLTLFDSVVKTSHLPLKTIKQVRPVGAVAALLHDIGHGPLSHVSERFLEGGQFNHEDMTHKVIMSHYITNILKTNSIDPCLVVDLLKQSAPTDLRFVSQLLSSQLDADRMDYLLRDSLFTGLQYGRIDMHRIASTMQLWHGDEPAEMRGMVVVDTKGIEPVASYILARHFMYRGAYQHKTIRCAESMLAMVFSRASSLPSVRDSIPGATGEVSPQTLLALDDHTCYDMLRQWALSEDSILHDLSLRLLRRDLFKTSIVTNPAKSIFRFIRSQEVRKAFTKRGLDMDYYLIDDGPVVAGYRPYSVTDFRNSNTATDHIMVINRHGRLEEISKASELVEATTRLIGESMVFYPSSVTKEVQRMLGYNVQA